MPFAPPTYGSLGSIDSSKIQPDQHGSAICLTFASGDGSRHDEFRIISSPVNDRPAETGPQMQARRGQPRRRLQPVFEPLAPPEEPVIEKAAFDVSVTSASERDR